MRELEFTNRWAVRRLLVLTVTGLTVACGPGAKLPVSAGIGPTPELPEPRSSLIPTVKIADAKGWSGDAKPSAAPGLVISAFARNLDHPRWLYVLPNGDVLVAETNAPDRPDDGKGIKAWFVRHYMKKAGAAVKSANRITLLRDADGDGIAETRSVFLDSLYSPFGMALVGDTLYIANSDAVVHVPYREGATHLDAKPTRLVALPAGTINHHWTKNLVASADGSRLYASIGSNSNAGENGIDAEQNRAMIWEIDRATGAHRVFASGLRNPVGMAWEPESGALWVSVNERDELGSDLVPDYMTAVRDGGFYGFPFSYYGQHVDTRVKAQRPDLVASALAPDFALGPHTASLGLSSSRGSSLPAQFHNGMFIGQHGSWNRKPRSGYKVIFVPFSGGHPAGQPVDVVTGFLDAHNKAQGRPVGVAIDKRGALLIADDVGNVVWRVTAARSGP
jgi:glucose/arabinose dehydrogenase